MRLRFPCVSLKLAAFWVTVMTIMSSSVAFTATSTASVSTSKASAKATAKEAAAAAAKNLVIPPKASSAVTGETSVTGTAPEAIQDDSNVGYGRNETTSTNESPFSWRRAKETKFAYKMGTGFDSFANEREQSQFFGFGLGGDFKAELSESLNFRVKAGVALSNGYAQSRFGDNVGKSGVFLDEAVMSLRLMNTTPARLYVAAGGLDQGALEAPLFVARQAFPGLKETLVLGGSKNYKFKIWAQQTIPTSKTLSTKTVDAEVTPSFLTETAEMTIQPIDSFTLKGAITHYAFNNLPSAVALESVIYGNTVDEIGPNTSTFKYRFDGMMVRGGVQFDLTSRLAWTLDGYGIQNMAAPEGYRNAQLIRTGFKIGLPGEIELYPSVGSFFVEDDVVPGFYNTSETGHNNRKGFGARLETFFQRQRFKIIAGYTDADVINYNINQSRQQTLSIGFETFYEML